MKKTAIALFALTGILLAGCSTVPSPNIIPQQEDTAIQQEQTIPVQRASDILFSDSIEQFAFSQQEADLQAIQMEVQRINEATERHTRTVDREELPTNVSMHSSLLIDKS